MTEILRLLKREKSRLRHLEVYLKLLNIHFTENLDQTCFLFPKLLLQLFRSFLNSKLLVWSNVELEGWTHACLNLSLVEVFALD